MGLAERGYSKGGGVMAQLTPVVKGLIILNLGLFFADMLFFDFAIRDRSAFSVETSLRGFRLWELVTFQFMHDSVGHVLFNCLGLFFFGPWMERWWGARAFLLFYLLCGVGGPLFYTALALAGVLPVVGLVGASAGIYGILVGVAVIAPSMRVSLLFPPVTLTMRQLALAALAISAGSILFEIGGNRGGEAGHLGGALMGFALMKARGRIGRMRGGPARKPRRPASSFTPKIRPRTMVDLHGETEVDAILDKISRDGFQSLTDAERDVLQRAAEKGGKKGL